MVSKIFVKEVRLKVDFLKVSRKALTKIKHLKMPTNGEFNFIKRPDTKSYSFEDIFCIIYMGDHRTLVGDVRVPNQRLFVGLKELSEFGCRFAWYFCRFRCRASVQIMNMGDTGPWETEWISIT